MTKRSVTGASTLFPAVPSSSRRHRTVSQYHVHELFDVAHGCAWCQRSSERFVHRGVMQFEPSKTFFWTSIPMITQAEVRFEKFHQEPRASEISFDVTSR